MVCLSRPYLFKFFEGCSPQILLGPFTAQKMKFSIKDFFSECDQIRSFLRIRSNFLKKSLMKNFYAVILEYMDWFTVRYVQSHIQNYIRHLDGAFCVTKWDGWQGCEYPFDAFAVGGPSFINPFVLSCFFNISICDALYDLVSFVQFKKR